MRQRTHLRSHLALCGLVTATGLAGCAYGIPEVDPVDIPRLQEELAADPANTELQVQLGMAHFKDQDFDQALAILQSAVDAGHESGPALLYLGMTREEFGEWSAAEAAYSRYLEVGRSEPLKQEVRNRLQLIGQNVLREQARLAIEEEANIGAPTPRSIAVMPFAYFSENEDYLPLIYAISDMMITDFAVSNAITVLERANIQTLLDEIGLTEDGYADPATGARAGRLLQAEHVVQGVLTPLGSEELRIDTDVLNVPNQSTVGSPSREDALQNLFDMEKELVFQTLNDVLGVELTPAEQQQILDNRADNVLAFLSYGRGLRERDRGNFSEAAAQFRAAQQADPGFQAASNAATQTQGMADAAATSTSDMASTAAATGETTTGTSAVAPPTTQTTGASTTGSATTATPGQSQTGSTSGTLGSASEAVDPTPTGSVLGQNSTQKAESEAQQQASTERSDPNQEATSSDDLATTPTAQIRIIVRRPGGDG